MNRLSLISITSLLLFISCSKSQPFDPEKWKKSADGTYPYRYAMIGHVLADSAFQHITEPEVIERLGPPAWTDEDSLKRKTLHYLVQIAYGWDIDPLFHSYLRLTFDPQSGKLMKMSFYESEDRRSFIEKLTTRKY